MKLLVLMHMDVEQTVKNLFYKYFNVSVEGYLSDTCSTCGFITYQSGESHAYLCPSYDLQMYSDWDKTPLDDFYDLCKLRMPYKGSINKSLLTDIDFFKDFLHDKEFKFVYDSETETGDYITWEKNKYWFDNCNTEVLFTEKELPVYLNITKKIETIITNKITGNVITI